MPHPLSSLGLIHTLVSLVPLVAGLHGFARWRRIEPGSRSGQVYLAGLAVSVFTSFGLSSVTGINPGHVLGVLALLAAFGGAWLAPRLGLLGRLRPYAQTFGLSFSFFLLLVPGINETLTRLPVAHPLATGPEDPVVKAALLGWLLVFVIGFTLQGLAIRAKSRAAIQR
ncbi:hypothetical protein CS062_02140 [Roseateles chitinivorans]|uniref:DUF2306 domain-containing protein n=1 Tax=Roseateles chitinivorans TaxID=2917965 RepID=A0A2G9CEZ1_9BURK|nr:hypothetical protein [Roseateles chitinivorans]PIM55018.1 hypothetical protein CS062_02140 [Roseateles chitinivorans]